MNPVLFKQKVDTFLNTENFNDFTYWLGFNQQNVFERLEFSLLDDKLSTFYSNFTFGISNEEKIYFLKNLKGKIEELILFLSEMNILEKPELTNDFESTWQPYYNSIKYLEYEILSLNEYNCKQSNEPKIQKSEFAELLQPKGIMNNTQLETFLNLFAKGSAGIYRFCAKSYYYEFKENFNLLKSEIYQNLIDYNDDQKNGYLKKIKYELNRANQQYLNPEHIERQYVELLQRLNIEIKPINELCEDVNQHYDTEFSELINFEYESINIKFMENERRSKGLKGLWYPIFESFFRTICDNTIQFFINELSKFLNDLESEYDLMPKGSQTQGIENEYLEIYFKKLFDIDLDFDKENERITFNGHEYKDGNELQFHVKKHLVDITHLFLKEINRNILITKDKETKNDYLLSIQKKNKWHQSNVKKLISKVESEGLYTFSNTNFCKITSAGKLLKMGEFSGSEFQTLNELITITYDTAETFNEELNNFITPDQNTNLYTKKENLIKWNSSPSHFGFIISELINKGYFENLPMYQGEVNYSEIARLFSSIVDFNTSEQNLLKSFNPNNEKISETVKNKFAIPNCEDIKPANSPNKVTIKKNTKPPIKTK